MGIQRGRRTRLERSAEERRADTARVRLDHTPAEAGAVTFLSQHLKLASLPVGGNKR